MNTKHLDYIIAISEIQNLSLASKRLGISQPVLSRYLSGLERQLGVNLFVQENRHLHITEAGQIYLNGVRRMKELQTQMLRSFEYMNGHKELTLRFGISPFHGGRVLAHIYPRLLERYPNLDVHIEEGHSQELLDKLYEKQISAMSNLYDFNLMPGTKAATYTKTEILIVLPNYHPFARSVAVSDTSPAVLTIQQLGSLTDIPFVSLNTQTIVGQIVDRACARYEFTPQTLLRTSNTIAINALLASGSYAGFLIREVAEKMDNLTSYRFPHPLFLYSGLVFLEEHQPTSLEQYLFQLEYQQAKLSTPEILHVNDFGKYLLSGGSDEY